VTLRIARATAFAVATLAVPVVAQAPLAPTAHPSLPKNESDLWLVPSAADRSARASAAGQALANAVDLYQDDNYAGALTALNRVGRSAALADYVDYYKGLARLRLEQLSDAKEILDNLLDRKPQGAIASAAALARGEVAEASGDHARAVEIYRRLAGEKHTVNEDVLSGLGRAAMAMGDKKAAAEAYLRLYYEFALTDAATSAATQLEALKDSITRTGYTADLGRAEMLFGAKRYTEARAAFQEIQNVASGDDRELADLRVAESDFYLRRYQAARDALKPYLENARRKGEAQFFYLSAIRELGEHEEYVTRARALVTEFPSDSWAEETLNNLGTHYILINRDADAAATFAELYQKFPGGSRAERAAWKSGWWSYRTGDFAATVKVFEGAAAAFPRSDYRPSFLYWAARAHAKLGAGAQAQARYRLVFTDYGNSYYGRLAHKHVGRAVAGAAAADVPVAASHLPIASAAPRPPTEERIRLLLGNGLYDDAIAELRYAQRVWGTSPAIEATMAWAYHQKGELRRAITLMRRAYPQSMTASGHELPVEIRQVLFPLVYWDLIKKQSQVYELDPYIIAALIGQESTFDPDIRSVANAWGLMQVVPATGRRLATALKIRRFSTKTLTNPEINIRLGTLYFARLVKQFGGTHYALASYNAGENRVVRWKAERPGMDEDEFIDDIPFPETQNYVKRILGTAEDYRMLYGRDGGRPSSPRTSR
jgi:soluble lytic murein transglycosylase